MYSVLDSLVLEGVFVVKTYNEVCECWGDSVLGATDKDIGDTCLAVFYVCYWGYQVVVFTGVLLGYTLYVRIILVVWICLLWWLLVFSIFFFDFCSAW